MALNETVTDIWVSKMFEKEKIEATPQGTNIIDIAEALKSSSKNGKGNGGFPDFIAKSKDFIIVVENKSDALFQAKYNEDGSISREPKDVVNYAVNGALHYAEHIIKNSSWKKVFFLGITGDEKRHHIQPYYIDESLIYTQLPLLESFVSFSESNIEEYYTKEVLKCQTDEDKTTETILKDAAILHEDLRNYGNLKDIDKPLIVAGILMALRESEFGGFNIDSLTGDSITTDGEKIYNAIEKHLTRARVQPQQKKDKIKNQFSLFKDTHIINEVNSNLGKTPLKHYTEFLFDKIHKNLAYKNTSEDILGRFYGQFMSYSGGDGQSLGIVLTPKHIVDLFSDLVDLKYDDVIIDPCTGTGGFLVGAMHRLFEKVQEMEFKEAQRLEAIDNIKEKQLLGYELQPLMFTIATCNMILRGDGKSNLVNEDFLASRPGETQSSKAPTVGMINPPYSQGSKKNPNLYEINFIFHMLNSLVAGGRAIAIIPQSSLTGKTKEEAEIKVEIMKRHTLEGVITLNPNTFYGVGTMPCIAIFKAGVPHPDGKIVKFIDFREDGFKVAPHKGLLETASAKDKKAHLLDVWFDRVESESKFCVKTEVEASDEWLHSFYYFNDEVPSEAEFEKTIADYLSFEFSMIMQGRSYLFDKEIENEVK